MSLKERIYSVLVVSSAEKLNIALSELLREMRCRPVRTVPTVSEGRRAWSERSYDLVIINSPINDDAAIRMAVDIGSSKGTVVMLLVSAEIHDEVRDRLVEHGVFTLPKPVSVPTLSLSLEWMTTVRERLRRMEKKSLSVEEKMEEIRVVNRAKWLLISEFKMDEPQTHRYIEKQAMDRCISKKEVAEEIIKNYS